MSRRVAVLGAGIMGVSTALFLARSGIRVTVFDREARPLNGASRWNEGKIHLGFLYAGDPSLRTADEVRPGGLAFKGLLEQLIGTSLDGVVTPADDIYLTHPDSIVDADAMHAYFLAVCHRVRGDSGYLAAIGTVEELSRSQLDAVSASPARRGFRVPERSVDTIWVADCLAEAVRAEPSIRLVLGTTVGGLVSTGGSWSGPWRVDCSPAIDEPFDAVVNALWEGRLRVDGSVGLEPRPGWTHRFRQSLFVETAESLGVPSAVMATGPFGDVKDYGNGRYYLSHYPTGLLAEGHAIAPPAVTHPETGAFVASVRDNLRSWFPQSAKVFAQAHTVTVGGGWVFAQGRGSLADPAASIHRRDRFGIRREGTYLSIDTGKYSTAPWLARKVADLVAVGS